MQGETNTTTVAELRERVERLERLVAAMTPPWLRETPRPQPDRPSLKLTAPGGGAVPVTITVE